MRQVISMELKGLDALKKRLDFMRTNDVQALGKILAASAFKTHTEAVTSIQQGQKSGNQYKRGGKVHTASAPGEAPATDSGTLVRDITVLQDAQLEHSVGSRKDAPHGFWLEFGTSKMQARPWLTPAFRKGVAYFRQAIQRAAAKRGLR